MSTRQEEYFQADALRNLFESRIVKSRAVGLDGVRLEAFSAKLEEEARLIQRKALSQTYKFTPYREKLILKGAKRLPRQISIPTIRDRLALRAVCNCLAELVPSAKTRAPHSYIKSIAGMVKGSDQPLSFLRVDVRDFFPTIDHEILISALKGHGADEFLVSLIIGAIKNWTGLGGGGKQNLVGIPQGLSISNVLSSIYMLEFDEGQRARGVYYRYVDDILIVAPSHQVTHRYKDVHTGLLSLKIEPHPMGSSAKTEIRRIFEGIDYLGYNLNPIMISVRKSSYQRMFYNLSKMFTLYKYKKNLDQFLFKLNLRITGCIVDGGRKGWLMFFSQTDNISQLKFLDRFVANQLRKLSIDTSKHDIARFVKTYHEIRYKGDASNYIPNFDSYSLAQQYEIIASLTSVSIEELESRSVEVTEREFKALVAKEVADLEQDVLESIS